MDLSDVLSDDNFAKGPTTETETITTDDQGASQSEDGRIDNVEGLEASELINSQNKNDEEGSEGDSGEATSLVDLVNNLGISRDGVNAEFKGEDEIKELISKGNDYTFKTQALSDQEKALTESFQAKEADFNEREKALVAQISEHQDIINRNNVLDQVVAVLQAEDPETFDIVNRIFLAKENEMDMAMNNPMFQQLNDQFKGVTEQLSNFQKGAVEKENSEIKDGWDKGLSELQTKFGAKLKQLGIKTNVEAVKKQWAAGEEIGMTHEQAFMAVHGSDIAKGFESLSKLNKTKAKSNQRLGKPATKTDDENAEKSEVLPGFRDDYLQKKYGEKYG